MKRALVVLLAFVGFSAFGIGTFSGKWDFQFCVSDEFEITTNSLTVNYTDFGWTFGGTLNIPKDLFRFTLKGALGPLTVSGQMDFDIGDAAYKSGKLTSSLDLAGMSFSIVVDHMAGDYCTGWCEDVCGSVEEGALRYTITTKVDPISLKVRFVDCCTGLAFLDLLVTLEGLSLCCGITYDVEFSFNKSGFDYVLFTLENFIQLCCGISLDASIEFGADYKQVSLTPKFAGVEACFTVYGDVNFSGGEQPTEEESGDLVISGLVIDGWLIKCEITDCSYLEIMTALSPEWFYVDSAGKIWHRPTSIEIATYSLKALFNKNCGEFEYIKLAVCGPGCCGGTYTVALSAFFGSEGGLFDLTKLTADAKIPIMSNFTLNLGYKYFICPVEDPQICFGWTFSF